MDREALAAMLEEGRSIESIARETGKSASTVAYWVNKHGLVSRHAPGTPRAAGSSASSCRRWSRKGCRSERSPRAGRQRDHGPTLAAEVRTEDAACALFAARRAQARSDPARVFEPRLGPFVRVGGPGRYRCARCNTEAVSDRRRRVKEILVAEAGGCCVTCGFDAYVGALQFHHRDPATKAFEVSRQGDHAIVGATTLGGAEVRATVRELPRDGRGRNLGPAH